MIFNPMPIEKLRPYVELAYEGDLDLSENYIAECDSRQSADATMWMIEYTSCQEGVNMESFGVLLNDGEMIGYVSVFQNNLYSFGINVKYRVKDILSTFWEMVIFIMKTGFITMLYPNNKRAIKFLEKCGMRIVDDVEESAVTLIYCQ